MNKVNLSKDLGFGALGDALMKWIGTLFLPTSYERDKD